MDSITVSDLARELGVTIPSYVHGTAADWLVSFDQTLDRADYSDDTELDADYADMIRQQWQAGEADDE